MREFVFTDEALASYAGQFVWFGMDVDKAENARLREKFPARALPSYFIVDSEDESVMLRWIGGATVTQLQQILEDGRLAIAGDERNFESDADRTLVLADQLNGAGKNAEAAEAYVLALSQAPEGWPRAGRATESLLLGLYLEGEHKRAAMIAQDAYPEFRGTASAMNVAVVGLDCALSLPAEEPNRMSLVKYLEEAARDVLEDQSSVISLDDRSSLFGILVYAREEAGDDEGVRRLALEWAAFLEEAAAQAAIPEQRTVFDSHRLSVYLELGEPERAIPMLEQSQRDFPDDYNPPGRLAVAYKALERWDEALASSDEALAKSYGPRRLRYMSTKADVYEAMGDLESAKRTLEEAVAVAEALPEGQRSERRTTRLQKKLASLN
jgi:tetratricopeptide (TPR) repeat protein